MWDFIGSLVGSGLNMLDSSINRQYNRDNMLLQSSLNTGQYMLERALESPEQMVKQFEAAGLNPALMYGGAGNSLASGSSISGVSSTSQPSTNPFRLTAPSIVEVAQKRNIDADTQGKEIDNKTREDKNIINLLNVKASIEEKLSKVKRNTAEAETLNKELGLIQARIDNYAADTAFKGAQTATEGAKKSNIEAQTETEGAKKSNIEAQTDLYGEQSKTESDKRYNLRQQANLYNSMADKEDEMVKFLKASTRHKNALTDSEVQELKRKVAQTVDIYARLGIDGAKAVNDIISTWVPSPGKLLSEVTEIFKRDTKSGTKVTKTKSLEYSK